MAGEIPTGLLTQLVHEALRDIDRDRRAQFVVDLTVVSLLVDAGICTPGSFAKRLDDTQAALSERFQDEETTKAIGRFALKIQDYGPKP